MQSVIFHKQLAVARRAAVRASDERPYEIVPL